MGTINLGVAALQSSRPRVHHHHHRAVIQNTKYKIHCNTPASEQLKLSRISSQNYQVDPHVDPDPEV